MRLNGKILCDGCGSMDVKGSTRIVSSGWEGHYCDATGCRTAVYEEQSRQWRRAGRLQTLKRNAARKAA